MMADSNPIDRFVRGIGIAVATDEERIADQIMAFCNGQHDQLISWLCSLGCQIVRQDDGVWTIQGISGVRSALTVGLDPSSAAVCVGFLVAGSFWPQAYPRLLPVVNAKWRQQREQ